MAEWERRLGLVAAVAVLAVLARCSTVVRHVHLFGAYARAVWLEYARHFHGVARLEPFIGGQAMEAAGLRVSDTLMAVMSFHGMDSRLPRCLVAAECEDQP